MNEMKRYRIRKKNDFLEPIRSIQEMIPSKGTKA